MDTKTFVDAYNAIAQDWAQTQGGRRGTLPPVKGVSWRRTWPDSQLPAHLMIDRGVNSGWADSTLDSTLDLRDGLSVIEVYADPDPADVSPLTIDFSRFGATATAG